jgi:hypothetical protein
MSQTIKLTAEEIALIEQKRAEEKAKQEELLKSYDHYRENTINYHVRKNEGSEKEQEDRKNSYEEIFNKLITISNDFKFICEKKSAKTTVNLYDIDNDGREIKYERDENGSVVSYLEPKEVVELETYYYELKIQYTGNVPEGCSYIVVPVAQYSRYSHRITGYKMQVQGTDINSWGKRGQMTNANNVHKKILEIVDAKFRQIEYKKEQDVSNNRIKQRFDIEFSKFVKNVTSINQNTFHIKLDNDITLEIYGYENGDGSVRWSKGKISFPYSMDVTSLLTNLNEIKGKE